MEERMYNLTIFLMKEFVKDYSACIKSGIHITFNPIKESSGLEGVIGTTESNVKKPRWKDFLQEFCEIPLDIQDNMSNKAVMLIKVKERIFALTFGYGRAFLSEEVIEKNFGFITALNLLDPQKIRSINAATIEDMVVHIQKQSSYNTGQEEFDLNTVNDIIMSVTGKAKDSLYANNVSGRDSLVVSVEMLRTCDLKDRLESYLEAYESQQYRDNGFSWIDNIREVRDSMLREKLDFILANKIEAKSYENIYVSPPDTLDWSDIKGFSFSGMGRKKDDLESFEGDIILEDYFQHIRPGTNIYQKLKRDKLYALNSEDSIFVISNVFSALTAQIEYEDNIFILCDGRWFNIENNFYKFVSNVVDKIPISTIDFPECEKDEDEGAFNERVAGLNVNFCLMDKKLVGVAGGSRKVEACDIFTTEKQFVHVKNKCRSSQLSHLFAQGRVSAECFVSDAEYRRQVSELIKDWFGKEIFDYKEKPKTDEYEVVYVIIDEKIDKLEKRLPFFSLVNLMLTVQDLDRMHMRYSIKMLSRKTT